MDERKQALLDIMEAVSAQAGTLWFYHRFEDGLIRPLTVCGGEEMGAIYLLPGEGIAGAVIDKGEALLICDCQNDERWTKKVVVETGFTTRSMNCVPITVHGMVFGSLQLMNKQDDSFFCPADLERTIALAQGLCALLEKQGLLADYRMEEAPEITLARQSDAQRAIFKQISIYTDPSIVREILRRDGKHKKSTETEELAVLFVDIRGFTGLAKVLTEAQLISALSDFLALTSGCIHRYNGIIDKFMGDCVMAYWPLSEDPKGALFACRAALAIQEEAKAFSAHLLRQTGLSIGLGIGLHAGPALLCHVGDEQYMAYTAIGHTVNTACRMEEYAPAGEIYISNELARRLPGKLIAQELAEDISWKSKDAELVVLRLLGLENR